MRVVRKGKEEKSAEVKRWRKMLITISVSIIHLI